MHAHSFARIRTKYRKCGTVLLAILWVWTCFPFTLYANAGDSPLTDSSAVNKSAFNPHTAAWDIQWPGRVAQYDVVYLSPPIDPLQGIPLGNGDVGVLFWCVGSKLMAAVNKCDLWDDAEFGRFRNWKREEEDRSTTLRHAGRMIIDFKLPVFDIMYLTDFHARLSLADASLLLDAQSVFGHVRVKAFVDHNSGTLLCDIASQLQEDVPIDISLERYGSRTFSHWYSLISRDASIGLAGTAAFAESDGAFLTQKLTSGTFAIGSAVIRTNNLVVKHFREHSRAIRISLSGAKDKKAQLALAVTSPLTNDPTVKLREQHTVAREKGFDALLSSHAEIWQSIWCRSFMDYGDEYLNNLWHLTMYYAIASQGGPNPGRFNNGMWTWSRDVQNWNFYFHWNQQQLYWPLNAAGHHELVKPYLDYRFNSLPHAREDAREFFKTDGAFVSDVTERRGYNSLSELKNHTPVAEIALDFWRQYRYTGDEKFLMEKALPFIIEAAKFYESLLVKESDGLYHAAEGTGYEGWIKMKDSLTELVYARALFSTALEALKAAKTNLPQTAKWKDILANCAPLPIVKAGETAISQNDSGYKLERGFFKGKATPTDEIVAAGWGIKEGKWLTVFYPSDDGSIYGMKLLDGVFPTVASSPVYPSGLIGLGQKGNRMFDILTATTLLYAPDVMGWDPIPIVMARLGLADELARILDSFPERWQLYCNGWGHIGVEAEVKKDAELFFRTNNVREAAVKNGKPFPFPMWPFRHMSMESMSVLATAMNEALLQSHDGVLRIAPAFPANKSGRFTLHAEGRFIVSAEIKSGAVQWIAIKSILENAFRVDIPWKRATVHSDFYSKPRTIGNGIATIKPKAGQVLFILPAGVKVDAWTVVSESPEKNEQVRKHASGKTQLGLPRMF